MLILPFLTITIQLVWLIKERKVNFDTVYFKWTISDVFLNSVGSIAYLLQLERISFEQKESVEAHLKALDQEKVKEEIHKDEGKPDPAKEPNRLNLEADYYSMTLCSFMKYYRDTYTITHEQKSIFFVNVLFVFGIQMFLLALSYYDLIITPDFLTMMHFDVFLTRLLCAFLMHMLSEPEVRQAIRMWKFVLNHGKARGSAVKLY